MSPLSRETNQEHCYQGSNPMLLGTNYISSSCNQPLHEVLEVHLRRNQVQDLSADSVLRADLEWYLNFQ